MGNHIETSQCSSEANGNLDTLRKGFFSERDRTAAIARAYLRPEMVVADVGGGTGFMSAGLAPLVRQVCLVDSSTEMLTEAKENLKHFDNLVFQVAEGLSIPLPDESMDAVFANMYLHQMPDALFSIREMSRILRPGGRLVITDLDEHSREWLRPEMADVWQGFSQAQLREWFKSAGLVNIIIDTSGQSCCAKPSQTVGSQPTEISIIMAVGTKRLSGVRNFVQAHYGDLAESGSSCCSTGSQSSSSCCSGSDLIRIDPMPAELFAGKYTFQDRRDAPAEALDFSLGCGNPVAIAGLQPGETVLDIGSGGGLDVFLAARRVGSTGKVIGVDMTPAMLERARKTAAMIGLSNVEFRQGQAESLPVPDGSVDVIISNCVINLCEDKGAVFCEAARALKPGGRLEISDMVTDGSFPTELTSDPHNWGVCVYGALPEQEYIDLIRQAGFREIRVSRSPAAEQVSGVQIYSAIISARKE